MSEIGANSSKALFKDTVGTCPKIFQCSAACGFDKVLEGGNIANILNFEKCSLSNAFNISSIALLPSAKGPPSPFKGKGK